MNELKTLKDLTYGCGSYPNCNKVCERIDIDDLRSEAIKWIKAHDWVEHEAVQFTHVEVEFKAICSWIKLFFNITDEELK